MRPQIQRGDPGGWTPVSGIFRQAGRSLCRGNSGSDQFQEGLIVTQRSVLRHLSPGSCSQAGCLAQPSGRWFRALEKGSGQSSEAGPEKTSPGLSHQKVRAKERVATWRHPGVIPGDCVVTSVRQ